MCCVYIHLNEGLHPHLCYYSRHVKITYLFVVLFLNQLVKNFVLSSILLTHSNKLRKTEIISVLTNMNTENAVWKLTSYLQRKAKFMYTFLK
ncbi:hypothetical protein AQUCO_00600315v1 [Aquilegia coerulea]|uniref:Uncharacterized protein n=1 Tax=Aquilegia coerulea TaxID=218851 RepID=A0A2G5ENZ6_AQUCA|nr:hypothetical protein AQUCO_00600315v1 [Aquilegia coerulea]